MSAETGAVVDASLDRVSRSIAEGEQAMASGEPMVTLDEVAGEDPEEGNR